MDIESVRQAAENGNAEACIEMGKFVYEQNKTAQGIDEANSWYEKAANLGHPHGFRMVILGKKMFAHAQTQIAVQVGAEEAYVEAGNKWDEVADWADRMKNLDACGEDGVAFASDEYFNACYHVCVCMICSSREKDAYEMFKNVQGLKADVIKGVAMTIESEQDLVNAYRLLKGVESTEYLSVIQDKAEEIVAALGALNISVYYRMIRNDPNQAYSSLNKIANALPEGVGKSILVDELSHYKKGMFGGYSYSD